MSEAMFTGKVSGLEGILAQIEGEARAAAQQTLAAAKARADEECAAIAAAADEECAAIAAKGRQQAQDAVRRAESAVQLQRRRGLLAAKQALIAETLQAALQKLQALPDDEYFAALRTLAVRYAQPGQGTLYFGSRDLARMPQGYEAALNAALGEGKSVCISPESRPIANGFVLAYGGIEENCSLSALFAADRDAMQDLAGSILFSAE